MKEYWKSFGVTLEGEYYIEYLEFENEGISRQINVYTPLKAKVEFFDIKNRTDWDSLYDGALTDRHRTRMESLTVEEFEELWNSRYT